MENIVFGFDREFAHNSRRGTDVIGDENEFPIKRAIILSAFLYTLMNFTVIRCYYVFIKKSLMFFNYEPMVGIYSVFLSSYWGSEVL